MKKLFGNKIEQNCEYCFYSKKEHNILMCKKFRYEKKPQKCRKFRYDPLKRVPKDFPKLPDFDSDEFLL